MSLVVNRVGTVFEVLAEHGDHYWLKRVGTTEMIIAPKAGYETHVPTPKLGDVWTDSDGQRQVVVGVLGDGSVATVPVVPEDGIPTGIKVSRKQRADLGERERASASLIRRTPPTEPTGRTPSA